MERVNLKLLYTIQVDGINLISTSDSASYSWDFGDGTILPDTSSQIFHLFDLGGVWSIKLFVNTIYGCSDSLLYTDYIYTEHTPEIDLGDTLVSWNNSEVLDPGYGNYVWPGGVIPNGATYLWSTGDTTEQITVNSSGSYSVVIYSPLGCTDTSNVYVLFPSSISIYPNPTSNELILKYFPLDAEISFIDLNGKIIPVEISENEGVFHAQMRPLKTGIYFVEIKTDSQTIRKKINKI